MAILTPALVALRRGFDVAAPGRDHSTDGWIGNAAHQAEVSGHNPDDTPGVRAEYSDADTIPEVRAIDVDVDLRALFSMQDVVDRIVATPNDTRRLRYAIFNRRIWSRSSGWVAKPYGGSDPHTNHAHFSGDPDTDNDGAPWSVETMGEADMTASEFFAILQDARVKGFFQAAPWQYGGGGTPGGASSILMALGLMYTLMQQTYAAALDDGNTTVVIDPAVTAAMKAQLDVITATLATVPEATVEQFRADLAQ
jgi:hypothetical protein